MQTRFHPNSAEQWEAVLLSSEPETQLRAVDRANEVAVSHGLTAI